MLDKSERSNLLYLTNKEDKTRQAFENMKDM